MEASAGSKREPKRVTTGPTGATVRTNIARLRKLRDLTLRELSSRLSELGHPISNPSLSQIENGSRRVDVDDLMAISIALMVSPNALLMPQVNDGEREIEVSGSPSASAHDLWVHLEGMRPLHIEEADRLDALDFVMDSQPPFLLPKRWARRSANPLPLMVHRKMQSDGLQVGIEVGVGVDSIFKDDDDD